MDDDRSGPGARWAGDEPDAAPHKLPLVTRIGRRTTRAVTQQPWTALAGAMAAAVLATSGLSYIAVTHFTAAVNHLDVFGPLDERPTQDEATNILLVGSDDRAGISEEERLELRLGVEDFGRHTDTMMLVHITADGAVDVISIPRDSLVTIPAARLEDGSRIDAHDAKINSAYSLGGPTLLVDTIEAATGVHIDHFVEVDFAGFMAIVDAVGGVDVCTPEPIQDELSGLDIPAGVSTLDGAMALSYVRARYFDPTADIGRMERQQQFLGSMFRKATSMGVLLNPLRLSDTIDAILASLTADKNLTADEVKKLMRQLQGTSPEEVTFLTVPLLTELAYLPDGGEAVQWDPQSATAIFDAVRQPGSVVDAMAEALAAIPTVEVAPAEVSVVVLNGSGVPGAAAAAAAEFATAGFYVAEIGNDSPTARTTVAYDPDSGYGLATLQATLPDALFVAERGLGDAMTVTVGADFNGLSPVNVASTEVIDEAPPAVAPAAPTTSAADAVCG